jgi:uracil-DNA glycosylase
MDIRKNHYNYCDKSWSKLFDALEKTPAFAQTIIKLETCQQQKQPICPSPHQIFRVYRMPIHAIKVVILGQDPYHTPHMAEGLAFSVPREQKIPPSLRNIFKEIVSDLGIPMPSHGHLGDWVQQGVFLLNTQLSTLEGEALAHTDFGWEKIISMTLSTINAVTEHTVFLLWGKDAHKLATSLNIDQNRHLILTSAHPSPLSAYRGFFGNRHFSHCNNYLRAHGKDAIDWSIR